MARVALGVLRCDRVVRRLLAGLVALPVILDGLNGLIVILLLFSLWHATVALGARLTLAFFAITTVTSWVFEEIGVVTGLIYGPYHYTSTLGPWLGSVPILIPLAWFMLVYPTYVIANLVVDGWPVGTPGGRGHLLRLALIGALVMTVWDLVVDPILSGPTVGAWVWERGGPYYRVPLQNSLGWILTTFTIYIVYRSLERHWTLQPVEAPPIRAGSRPLAERADEPREPGSGPTGTISPSCRARGPEDELSGRTAATPRPARRGGRAPDPSGRERGLSLDR